MRNGTEVLSEDGLSLAPQLNLTSPEHAAHLIEAFQFTLSSSAVAEPQASTVCTHQNDHQIMNWNEMEKPHLKLTNEAVEWRFHALAPRVGEHYIDMQFHQCLHAPFRSANSVERHREEMPVACRRVYKFAPTLFLGGGGDRRFDTVFTRTCH
jgi:hypothetical protein